MPERDITYEEYINTPEYSQYKDDPWKAVNDFYEKYPQPKVFSYTGQYDVNVPDWLQERSKQGLGKARTRDMYMQSGIGVSTQSNEAQRYAKAQFGNTRLRGGFQQSMLDRIEGAKQGALNQLWSAVDFQNEFAKEDAIERIKNIEDFNKRMKEDYEYYGEEYSFEMNRMAIEYRDKINAYNRQQDAAENSLFGQLLGSAPMWMMMLYNPAKSATSGVGG